VGGVEERAAVVVVVLQRERRESMQISPAPPSAAESSERRRIEIASQPSQLVATLRSSSVINEARPLDRYSTVGALPVKLPNAVTDANAEFLNTVFHKNGVMKNDEEIVTAHHKIIGEDKGFTSAISLITFTYKGGNANARPDLPRSAVLKVSGGDVVNLKGLCACSA
jgi:hypothetical protein